MRPPLYILYGTHTGNAERLAGVMARKCREQDIAVVVSSMASVSASDVSKMDNLAVIVSTHGIGEPPVQASELYAMLHGHDAPRLDNVHYAVLALGDSSYSQFCQTGKDFDDIIGKLGGRRLLDRVDCDVDFADEVIDWMQSVISSLRQLGA